MKELRKEGFSYAEIAQELGRSLDAIEGKFFILNRQEEKEREVNEKPESPEKKGLSDYTPREIFKYLYALGYRLDKDGLYMLSKQRVNLQSVISE